MIQTCRSDVFVSIRPVPSERLLRRARASWQVYSDVVNKLPCIDNTKRLKVPIPIKMDRTRTLLKL